MNAVRLPALHGRSPLGVLSAMGTLRLLSEFTDDPPRLSWCRDDLIAVLHSQRADVETVAADLIRIVDGIEDEATLPGVGTGFPPEGPAPDRLRVPQGGRSARRWRWRSCRPGRRRGSRRPRRCATSELGMSEE